MADDPNVLEPEWEREVGPVARLARLAAAAGARDLGATLVELDPGGQIAPYHLHLAHEELLVVLAGRPELRTPQGLRVLEPGAVVSFPPGPDGAHRVRNTGDEPVRYLIVSTMRYPEVAEHVDTGTKVVMTGPGQVDAFPAGAAGRFGELMRAAVAAEPDDL